MLKRLLRLLLGTAYVLFVAGGLFSGWVFLQNASLLANRPDTGARQPSIVTVFEGVQRTVESVLPPLVGSSPPRRDEPVARPPEAPRIAIPNPADLLGSWSGRERLNVVLLGIDQRDDESALLSRTDTVMLVSIEPVARSVVMMSFPRDLWVNIPGYQSNRINVAHPLGGPQLVMKTIEANFGITPTHYARVNFHGFEDLVDAIGGVPVDVERPVKDDEYPTEDYGLMRIFIAPGPQWMDGKTALQYARSRHSENDFARSRRQQRVLMAIRERAADPRVWPRLLPKVPELSSLVQKTVATSFEPHQFLGLARLAMELDRERTTSIVFDAPAYATPFVGYDGAQLLQPNGPAIRAAIASSTGCSSAGKPKIEVLNGTGRAGLAKSTADVLLQKGLGAVTASDADRTDYQETVVYSLACRESDAGLLAAELGLPTTAVRPLPPGASGVDIRVILGRNFQLAPR